MANTQHPGFMPSKVAVGGGSVTYVRRRVLTNNTDEIATQDSVKATSAGDILGLGTSATFATAIAGVCMGVSYVDATYGRLMRPSLPAATTYTGSTVDPVNSTYAFVTDAGDVVDYRCSVSAAIALTNIFNNFDINLAASVNGISQQELRGASANTTNTLPWRVLEFVFQSDNTLDSATHTHVYARINRSMVEAPLTDGTGT